MGARGWFAGFPNVFPAESVATLRTGRRGQARRGPRAVRAAGRRVPLGLAHRVRAGHQAAGWTWSGGYGGAVPAAAGAADAGERGQGARGHGAGRSRRWTGRADAVGSHDHARSTRTPRACRPGSSPAASRRFPGDRWPRGATTSSAHLDDLRQFLVNEPRGHAAMSGAILQPPTRPDADWGVLFIEVSGLPADVRARHHRRGDGVGGDRHGPGHRAGHRDPARHPGRPGHRRRSRSRTARAERGDRCATCDAFVARARRDGRRAGHRRRCATTWPTAATSTRS